VIRATQWQCDELENAWRGLSPDNANFGFPHRELEVGRFLMAIRRIGQVLVDLGFMTEEQLDITLSEQHQRPGELLGRVAQDLGFISDEQLAQGLAEQMGLQTIIVSETELAPEVLGRITEPMAQMYRVIPILFDDNRLTIATCDPQNLAVQDELRTFLGYEIRVLVATEHDIQQSLDKYFDSGKESVENIVAGLESDEALKKAAEALENAQAAQYGVADGH
jgi:type IV pilus assembly protein PilB